MLRWRILLGTVFIAALVGLVWLDFVTTPPAVWLFGLVLVVGLAAAQEVISLFAAGGLHPAPGVIYGGTLLVLASNAVPLFWLRVPDDCPLDRLAWPLIALAVSLVAAIAAEMRRYTKPGGVMVQAALAFFGVAYVGLLLTFALQLRVLGGPVAGMVAVIAMLTVVKLGDIGAYTVGRLIGKHKMSPVISPGKTIEGAVGALVFACVGSWFVLTVVARWLDAPVALGAKGWITFGVVVCLAGILGDLAESLFKRDMGRKDSSAWLPGFGGVLDLLDSVLFAAPAAYLCWLMLMG